MAGKPKPKTASPRKSKAKKSADSAPAKSADAPEAATAKIATAKTAAKAGKKAKAKTAKKAAAGSAKKPTKSDTPATPKHDAVLAETFYVCSGPLPLEIRDAPPVSGTPHVEFSSFAAARDHLLDQLIEAIEHYERVLHAIRGAASFAEYRDQQG